MIEVEIKIQTDLDTARKRLIENGFEYDDHVRESDTYYDNVEENIRRNDTALRIRMIDFLDSDHSRSYITFKGNRCDDISMTRPEYESLIESPDDVMMILMALGYKPVEPKVIKERTLYVNGSISACLDRVEGLGDFLELEIITGKESKDEALTKLWKMLDILGYKREDTSTISYLSMLQKQKQ